MSDIFISYKHAQSREARQLASALAARGWTVWWDWNIPTRADWQAELDTQLDAAGCVVVLWSAESVQSEWVLYEARHGQRAGKLIQVLLQPMQPPAEFAAQQGVSLAGWEFGAPFHPGFDRLRAAIRDLLDQRAPLAASRSGTLTRVPGAAGDALQRDASAAAKPRPRPAPVMLLPAPFRDLLDRRDDCATIDATLAERRNVALGGEAGIGKSALLSYLGNLDQTARFHDGVVYLQAAAQGENDLGQALHEAFYDVPPGVRPSAVEIRRNLADKCALVLLDDADLPAATLGTINAYAPQSAWVFASEVAAASAQRRPVALRGLPTDDGIALFERTLSRPLSGDERALATRIVDSVHGHPARIEQAAGAAAAQGVPAALAELGKPPRLAGESPQDRLVLAALACGGSVPLEAEQCAAIAGVSDVRDVLAGLVRRGLAQAVAPGFRLAAGLAPQVEATPEFAGCRERATAAFTRFAFEARGTPRRVARLAAPMMASMAWASEHGRSPEALRLARAIDGPLADANRWDAWRDMLTQAHDIATRAGDLSNASWSLHQQGTRAGLLDDKREAKRLLRAARSMRKRIGDSAGLKVTGGNLKVLGWARWAILTAVLAGMGVTTLGAIVVPPLILRPAVDLVPGGLDFGTQDVRAAPQQQALRIDNKGFGGIDVLDVSVQGTGARSFTVGNSCDGLHIPRTLACRLLVQFKPDGAGPRDATIAIRVRDVETPYVVPVRGVGAAAAIAQLSPRAVDFGAVEISRSEDRRVTLRNAGSAPLTAASIAIETDAAVEGHTAFRIIDESCSPAPIAPDAQCAIDLRFAPREAAGQRATLVIRDDAGGSPRSVALAGEGRALVRFDVRPGNLDFGRQDVGTESAAQPVRLRNAGNVPLAVRQVALDGSDAFRMRGSCENRTLAPGAECVLDLRFSPAAIQAATGRLVIASDAGPRSVALSGSGVGRPAIEVTPSRLDFGALKPGAAARTQRVRIASVGSDALLLRAPVIEGDGRFSQVNGCPERLAPRAECFIEVGLEPAGGGTAGARLVVAHNGAGGPAVVPLRAEIEATPPPFIERFDASPPALAKPGNVRLCFRVRNASGVTISGGPQPPSNAEGCVDRLVRATTTFTLTATGEAAQRATATVTVDLQAQPAPPAVPFPTPTPTPTPTPSPTPPPTPPMALALEAAPAQLKGPGDTRLCFAARNAERVVIEPGGPQPQSPIRDCVTRAVSKTTTFTATALRTGASPVQRTATVTVAEAPPPPPEPPFIVEFRANPPELKAPGQSSLCFTARNAERAVIEPGEGQPSSPNGGCVPRSVAKTTTFRLTVSRPGAPAQQRNATVTVHTPPPGNAGPLGVPAKDGVILKDKLKPGAVEAMELVGYCCKSGNVSRLRKTQCSAGGGRWFASPPSSGDCPAPGPVIK